MVGSPEEAVQDDPPPSPSALLPLSPVDVSHSHAQSPDLASAYSSNPLSVDTAMISSEPSRKPSFKVEYITTHSPELDLACPEPERAFPTDAYLFVPKSDQFFDQATRPTLNRPRRKSIEVRRSHSSPVRFEKSEDCPTDLSQATLDQVLQDQQDASVYATVRDVSQVLMTRQTTQDLLDPVNRKDSGYLSQRLATKTSEVFGTSDIPLKTEPTSEGSLEFESGQPILTSQSYPEISELTSTAPITPDSLSSSFPADSQFRRVLRRKLVLQELLETEQMYVNDLKMLVENCFDRLHAVSWLPLGKKCLLIRNASDLFKFQEEFLSMMEQVIPPDLTEQTDLPIGSIFIDMEPKFSVYTHYCTQHDGALKILAELEKKPEMINFLQDFKGKTQTRLDVRDFLIKPVQRICKYPLLLNELIKLTDDDSPNLRDLLKAHSVMQNVAAEIDSAKWYLENLQRTDRFFARLEKPDMLMNYPPRSETGEIVLGNVLLSYFWDKGAPKFIYMGVFLFSEHLFIVKIKKATLYQVKFCFHLRDLKLVDSDVPSNSFCLMRKEEQRKFIFCTTTEKEKKVWLDILQRIYSKLEENTVEEEAVAGKMSLERRASIDAASVVNTGSIEPPKESPASISVSAVVDIPEASIAPLSPIPAILLKRTSSTGSLAKSTLSRRLSIDQASIKKSIEIASKASLLSLRQEQKQDDTTNFRHQKFPTYAARGRPFWRQSDPLSERAALVSALNSPPNLQGRRGSVDHRVADVVTPNIENLKFIVVAGLLVPKCAKQRMSSPTISSLPFPPAPPFPYGLAKAYSSPDISLPNSSPTRSFVTIKHGSKTVRAKLPARLKSWGKASSIVETEDANLTTQLSTCSTVIPEDRATSPCLSIESTEIATQTVLDKEVALDRADTVKTLAQVDLTREKRRPSFASSIRKSFSFARPSTDQAQQEEKSPSRLSVRKERGIFGPVLQTLRERASTHRIGIAQLFKKKE